MHTTRLATIVIALIAFSVSGFQALPNQDAAKDLLERVAQTYKSLTTYHFEGTVTSEMRSLGAQAKIEAPFVIAAIKPDRMRVEIKSQAMGMESVSIASGRTTWEYLPQHRQYTKKESRTYDENELYIRMWAVALGVRLPQFEHVTERLKEAKILREESVEVSGSSRHCYVIEAEYNSSGPQLGIESSYRTFWVERDRYTVLKEVATDKIKPGALGGATESTYLTTFTIAKLNEPLPDALFIFTPPEGAKEVKQLGAPQKKRTI